MSHKLVFSSGSYTVWVDDISIDESPVLAKHQILDANYTTTQYMGGESYTKSIQFTLTTGSDVTAIRNKALNGYQVVYIDDTGDSGSFIITKFSYRRLQALNYAYPWFKCSMSMTYLPDSGSLYYQWTAPDVPAR